MATTEARSRLLLILVAVSGFVGVAAGALAAHGLASPQAQEWMRTGANWQVLHSAAALAALAIAAQRPLARLSVILFLLGNVAFCGALYALALGAPPWLGAAAPMGGLLHLAAWGSLAFAGLRRA